MSSYGMSPEVSHSTRRNFLWGSAITLGAGLLEPFTRRSAGLHHAVVSAQASASGQSFSANRQVVVFQDRAMFDVTGVLSPYIPPVDSVAATRRYVQSLDEVTFYSRHWFV